MPNFDDFIADALGTAEEVFGGLAFTIDAVSYTGILNEFSGDEEVELGGVLYAFSATLVCQRPQFSALTAPLHKTLQGKHVLIDGIKYRVAKAIADTASVTLGLQIVQ